MDNIDAAEIARKVYEASKDSNHYKRQVFKTERAKKKGQVLSKKVENFKRNERLYREKKREAKMLVADLERDRDLSRTWFHIDMDMFYAAVEIRDNPSLADRPLAIGSMQMISTANYVARKYGVRAAMPGFIGVQLCPNLTFIPCNYRKYQEVASVLRDIVKEYDPYFVSVGLDEVNMDVTDYLVKHDIDNDEGRQELSHQIRTRVFEATKLTCSAGIAPNRMLAKISSDWNKPNGQAYVPPDRDFILEFIGKLPIRKMPGIGGMTETALNQLGIKTGLDLREKALDLMISYREVAHTFLIKCGLGLGQKKHFEAGSDETYQQKGISID